MGVAAESLMIAPCDNETENESWCFVRLTEAQACEIASGYVPNAVKAMVLCMIDWRAEDERRANRPVQKRKKAI